MTSGLVKFDEHGLFEVTDQSLLDVVAAGWTVKSHHDYSDNNNTCGSEVNGECTGPNGSCVVAVDNVCGPNNHCEGAGVSLSGNIGCL